MSGEFIAGCVAAVLIIASVAAAISYSSNHAWTQDTIIRKACLEAGGSILTSSYGTFHCIKPETKP